MHNPIETSSEAETDIEYKDPRILCIHQFDATPTRPSHRCGSPALRGQAFCYYHHPTRSPVRNPNERRARRNARQAFSLPIPTNQQEFRLALSEIMSRLAANQIDTRRAALLLSTLQIVGRNLPAFSPPSHLRENN
jgi:hypothetical protein